MKNKFPDVSEFRSELYRDSCIILSCFTSNNSSAFIPITTACEGGVTWPFLFMRKRDHMMPKMTLLMGTRCEPTLKGSWKVFPWHLARMEGLAELVLHRGCVSLPSKWSVILKLRLGTRIYSSQLLSHPPRISARWSHPSGESDTFLPFLCDARGGIGAALKL